LVSRWHARVCFRPREIIVLHYYPGQLCLTCLLLQPSRFLFRIQASPLASPKRYKLCFYSFFRWRPKPPDCFHTGCMRLLLKMPSFSKQSNGLFISKSRESSTCLPLSAHRQLRMRSHVLLFAGLRVELSITQVMGLVWFISIRATHQLCNLLN
jgi:hypothetical protein